MPQEVWEEKWGTKGAACGKKVAVTCAGKTVVGERRDTMPHLANIKSGAGIDLNPSFAKAFGLEQPFMTEGLFGIV